MSDNQMNPESWAELFRLREEIKGPPGFDTWKDAAISEKIKGNKQAARIAELEKDAARWIPVSERIPLEADGTVVVKLSNGCIVTAWASYWHGASSAFAQWSFSHTDDDGSKVTHWAYLPKEAMSKETAK